MDHIESIEQKLDQIEKIIQICLQSMPHIKESNSNTKLTIFASQPRGSFSPGLNNVTI